MVGGVFNFAQAASANLREKEDAYNTAIGGFLGGSIIGLRSKFRLSWTCFILPTLFPPDVFGLDKDFFASLGLGLESGTDDLGDMFGI